MGIGAAGGGRGASRGGRRAGWRRAGLASGGLLLLWAPLAGAADLAERLDAALQARVLRGAKIGALVVDASGDALCVAR